MATIKWSKDRVRKILIIKMRYIGDTVLVTPLISALKKALPLAEMHLLIHSDTAPVVKGHPEIDNLHAFDYIHAKKDLLYFIKFVHKIKKLKFDMVIDLTRNDRSALLTALTGAVWRIGYDGASLFQKMAYTHKVPFRSGKIHMVDHHLQIAGHLGLPVDNIHPNLAVSRREIRDVRHRLDGAGLDATRPYVLIHPGARRWYKSWPTDRFARIADAILEHYPVQVVISGAPGDQAACGAIASAMTRRAFDLCGVFSLSQLPALIEQGALLIGNDSAPIHIATAVNTPVVALFGPTRWEDWQPRRSRDVTLFTSLPCRPCGHSSPDCPLGDATCMAGIPVERVWKTVEAFFADSGIAPF